MFDGLAEEAMNLYISLFPNSRIIFMERYKPHEHQAEGTVKLAVFTLCGREYRCIDGPVKHDFGFTPAVSLYVDCQSEEELDDAFQRLSDGGVVLMPLGDYGFSSRFGWLNDRFGVSWQLNLP
jgi:predicted 3-demethylubiquinone-9 3-methyltransferase (glyoxalase superfamily)